MTEQHIFGSKSTHNKVSLREKLHIVEKVQDCKLQFDIIGVVSQEMKNVSKLSNQCYEKLEVGKFEKWFL